MRGPPRNNPIGRGGNYLCGELRESTYLERSPTAKPAKGELLRREGEQAVGSEPREADAECVVKATRVTMVSPA